MQKFPRHFQLGSDIQLPLVIQHLAGLRYQALREERTSLWSNTSLCDLNFMDVLLCILCMQCILNDIQYTRHAYYTK